MAFLLVGLSGPVFMEMFPDFGMDPLPLRLKVVSVLHWWWTLPLGLGVAFVLAKGRRRWSVRTNRIAGVAIIMLSVAILLAFALSVFTPVFRM